ncbi:hypothetical protein DX912_17535 [Lysobacter soli]|uniref:Uncharacterized protein n=1 Tax=Lysobacter soli TaxID=453783 RepID=A0A3D8V7M7_9GAMM|nr:hypothetical protein DX912_17535 [Lysobacter soli]
MDVISNGLHPQMDVIPAKAGIQAVTASISLLVIPAKAGIHSDVLEEQQPSAVRKKLFTLSAPLPLTPTPLPMGEGL